MTHFYRPAEGHRLPHDPFNAIVGPRPIGWIATLDARGRRNLAPYSFFNALNYQPPLVGFSSNAWKDTVANCQETGEFTWNLVTRTLAERMNATSTTAEVDEFDIAGLEAAASSEIAAPRVAASPVNFECRVTQIIDLRTVSGEPSGSSFVVGEVVAVHIEDSLLVEGSSTPQQLNRCCAVAGRARTSGSTWLRSSICTGRTERPARHRAGCP